MAYDCGDFCGTGKHGEESLCVLGTIHKRRLRKFDFHLDVHGHVEAGAFSNRCVHDGALRKGGKNEGTFTTMAATPDLLYSRETNK